MLLKKLFFLRLILLAGILFPCSGNCQKKSKTEKADSLNATIFKGISFRSIGPAVTSGRVVDFAVNPNNHKEYFVAAAAGGVWKTFNAGITYDPVFENEGSYSIGCIRIDPTNSNVVWVGSGENNNQRSVSY